MTGGSPAPLGTPDPARIRQSIRNIIYVQHGGRPAALFRAINRTVQVCLEALKKSQTPAMVTANSSIPRRESRSDSPGLD